MLAAGCAPIKDVFLDNGCTWDSYIYASRLDTPETLTQILAHNQTHSDQCSQ